MSTTLAPPPLAPALALPPAKLLARGLGKRYPTATALEPTDLEIAPGEFVTVLGPSGSGKTTLLQLVCGLVEPTSGQLLIDGVDQTHTPAHRRRMGVVFQNYALFPHLTVAENVAFALDIRRIPRPDRTRRVAAALDMVGLAPLAARFPRELSGGQQQRVALARCFVYEPSLILMDEPLGALDRKLRESLQIEIKRLHRQTGATILFVTHDQDEALALSDRICLMNAARVEQVGTPEEIYEHPATLFAAGFIGLSNVLPGTVAPDGATLLTPDGPLPLPTLATPGQHAALVVRPEHTFIEHTFIEHTRIEAGAPLPATVTEIVYAGAETRLIATLSSGTALTIRRQPADPRLALGDPVRVTWSPAHARLLATHGAAP